MASTVYYGKSVTAANTQVKEVILTEAISPNTLKGGDLLVVLFTQGNTIDNPSIVLKINDQEQEISITIDEGKAIVTSGGIGARAGAWSDGETVTFVYTQDQLPSGVPSTTYTWYMINGTYASTDTYGKVLLDADDDNSAISRATAEEILIGGTETQPGISLEYVAEGLGDKVTAGFLNLKRGDIDLSTVEIQIPEIEIPSVEVPTLTSQLTNDGSSPNDSNIYLEVTDQGAINVGQITATGLLLGNGAIACGSIETGSVISSGAISGGSITTNGALTAHGNTTLDGGATVTTLTAQGTTTINGRLQIGNGHEISAQASNYLVRLNGSEITLKNYILKVVGGMDTEVTDTTDTFILDTCHSKNLVYPAGSAKPSGIKNIAASILTTQETTYNDTVVKVTLPEKMGYKIIAIVGHNVTETDNYASTSAPSKMNVYQVRKLKNNGTHYANCQMRNMNTEENIVYVSFQVLYQKIS